MYDKSLLHEYLDGSLEPDRETEFFRSLTESDELRSRFRQMLAVRQAFASDPSIFTPRAETTLKIFSSLGFSLPAAGTGFVKSKINTIKSIVTSNLATIVTAAATCLITVGISYLAFHDSASNKVISVAEPAATQALPAITESVPVVTSREAPSIIHKTHKIIQHTPVNPLPPPAERAAERATPAIEWAAFSTGAESLTDLAGKSNLYNYKRNFKSLTSKNFLERLSFEVKGSYDWNLPKESIEPRNRAVFSNMSFAIYYNLTENWAMGLELRQENFFQQYSTNLDDFVRIEYEQTPNFITGSLCSRFTYRDFSWLQPTCRIAIGGNQSGMVGRLAAGFGLVPVSGISFLLEVDASGLIFYYKNQSYFSKKIGFNYGIVYNF